MTTTISKEGSRLGKAGKELAKPANHSGLWPWLPLGTITGLLVGLAVGDFIAMSGAQVDPKTAWYLSRAIGIAAYDVIWLSMVMGLLITSRTSRLWPGGPAAVDVHKFTSLLGLGLGAAHGIVLLGDQYIDYSLVQVLVPFASAQYRPLWTGLGQLSLYLLATVALSFYVRRRIGPKVWRALHFLSFAVFCLALIHGIAAGSDSANRLVSGLYFGTGSIILFLTLYRVLGSATGLRSREVSSAPHPEHSSGRGR